MSPPGKERRDHETVGAQHRPPVRQIEDHRVVLLREQRVVERALEQLGDEVRRGAPPRAVGQIDEASLDVQVFQDATSLRTSSSALRSLPYW